MRLHHVFDNKERHWSYIHGVWGNEELTESVDTLAELDRRHGPLTDMIGQPVHVEDSDG